MAHNRRLDRVLRELQPPAPSVGTLKLGDISYDVPIALDPSRLPHCNPEVLLDVRDGFNLDNLHFMMQKYLLGQDIFLLSQPGPYARRLALTFCRLINSEYEYIALHRDVGETELKQGREIKARGNLTYVDSAAVRAVKAGRILIIEGIEKAERGIMPVLNNLLENREMNLDDGTHILHPHRHALLDSQADKDFIPAHKNFRVIAIAAPVPPYPGYPLDPPFRSRFQARFIDPIGSLVSFENSGATTSHIHTQLREIVLATQYASETPQSLETVSKSTLPAFPQTTLGKLNALFSKFPPPDSLNPAQLARLVLSIHPALIYAPFQAWALLSRQVEEAGLGVLGSPSLEESEDASGMLGYLATDIRRVNDQTARIMFQAQDGRFVTHEVAAGPHQYLAFPISDNGELFATTRFVGLLSSFLQTHALGFDISYIPPALPSTASCSTSSLVKIFGAVLGYERDAVHMYKELGGRELLMRRKIENGGETSWEPSPITEGALKGRLVHLSGLDVIGPTAGSLSRLLQDREMELWETNRIVSEATEEEKALGIISVAHPSFRIISTASKSIPLKDWLSDEHANMFFAIAAQPMSKAEESTVLSKTNCAPEIIDKLLQFAELYRSRMTTDSVQKNRKLGTRALVRIARRVAMFRDGQEDLYALINQAILSEFLPTTEKANLEGLFEECGLHRSTARSNPTAIVNAKGVEFPDSANGKSTFIPRFNPKWDQEGFASHVPHMDHFFDNSLQTGSMRDLAVDFELLGEHLVLLGNQGVGKNKLIDRLCQILGRPREYIQLHRDTTVNQLMFNTSLEDGVIKYTDSPLLRAVSLGRVIIIDEADKAPEHVVAVFRSLAGQGEMTLGDGRRIRRTAERPDDIVVHSNFRLILLANRPGYPFLGNHFLQVLGDNFSCHSITNPDMLSERRLLSQLAPDLDEDIILRLVGAFNDLRHGYEIGSLTYPYSLRELINIVRHMSSYPGDSLETTLRNIFDFDIYKKDTIEKLAEILDHHGLAVKNVGLDAARQVVKKKVLDIKFEPTGSTSLDKPKFGKEDPNNEPHTGGNTWAGGTGGRDTAGLGGRGGYMRLFKGHDIKQVPDALKEQVPDHIQDKAREMARQELARRLEELNMTPGDAKTYGDLLSAVQAHIAQLHDLLENLAAKEEERVWVKRQTDGELDFSRLTEGLTGEATVYKRRGMAKPEIGRPQIKPKRVRFLFDLSASMYRFQYDGRLERSKETAVMLMETFDRLTRKDKYVWDIYGHASSGDSPTIPLIEADEPASELRDRFKVVEKMNMIPQYTFAGDYTVEAIENASKEVSRFDADDWFVITVTDANFGRYNISVDDLNRSMNRYPKVHNALICIGEGAEATWVSQKLQGRGFRVANTADIPNVLRSILSTMVDT